MRTQPKGSAALKHGGYSGLTLLPGEDRFAFEKLRRELFAELKPQGRLEQEIVTDDPHPAGADINSILCTWTSLNGK